MLLDTVYHHHTSYDMNVRPTILFRDAPMENPVEELPAAIFYQLTGFWPGQFEEIINNLLVLPDTFVCNLEHIIQAACNFFAAKAMEQS